jgi:YidC/Oxa1 family membrane protein insertase
MGKTETIGIILITVLLFAWMWLNTPKPIQHMNAKEGNEEIKEKGSQVETAAVEPPKPAVKKMNRIASPEDTTTRAYKVFGRYFAPLAVGKEKVITISTDLYTVVISTKGGLIKAWTLNDYKTWRGDPVELINQQKSGDYSILFESVDGKLIDTKDLYFTADFVDGQHINVPNGSSYNLKLTLTVGDSSEIIKTFVFHGGEYDITSDITFKRMDALIADFEYQVTWENGLNYTEENSVDESSFSTAYAYNGGETVSLEANDFNKQKRIQLSGRTDWVSQTTKYFTSAIIARSSPGDGAYLAGTEMHAPDNGIVRSYSTALQMRFRALPFQSDTFQVYVGPLDYKLLKSYGVGLEKTVGLGWQWVVRPIAEYVMLPAFEFLHSFIPNYGIVIIIFSIIIKLLLNPLTITSMKSMRKMQALQPLMEEIKEKYKDDPQKMNQAVMNLYKEYKINPAGGCLPMILQLPILYALWAIFRSNIALRQADFFWWIKDLSVPDTILRLPFTLPIIGLNQISGLALLMAITMLIQQKMTVKDPRQQFMVWFMPALFWILFNNFPSGLNLYYFVFNLLSIGQQYLMNKKPVEEVLVRPVQKSKWKKRS